MSLDWTLAPDVRALLVCPRCRGELGEVRRGLICVPCDRVYPVKDGVPWMVEECAVAPTDDERTAAEP